MVYRFSELKKKWVVDTVKGSIIGKVGDLEINGDTNQIISIIVCGRSRFWGLFGKEDDYIIRWENIDVIGDDAVLVIIEPQRKYQVDYDNETGNMRRRQRDRGPVD